MNLEKIIKGCIKHKSHSQEELYNLYKDSLFALSLKYCCNEAEAEDNLHNAFIEIFTNIEKFNSTGSFEGWMKRITINKAINSYKKQFNLVALKDDYQNTEIDESEMNLPLDQILKMVQELPNQYRLVFSLYELDNYSHKEIAIILEISESASKSNLHRAKCILKTKIIAANSSHTKYSISNGK